MVLGRYAAGPNQTSRARPTQGIKPPMPMASAVGGGELAAFMGIQRLEGRVYQSELSAFTLFSMHEFPPNRKTGAILCNGFKQAGLGLGASRPLPSRALQECLHMR